MNRQDRYDREAARRPGMRLNEWRAKYLEAAAHAVMCGDIECAETVLRQADKMCLGANTPNVPAGLQAQRFLVEQLARYPLTAKELMEGTRGEGLSWSAVRRAAKALNIVPTKIGARGPWVYHLTPWWQESYERAAVAFEAYQREAAAVPDGEREAFERRARESDAAALQAFEREAAARYTAKSEELERRHAAQQAPARDAHDAAAHEARDAAAGQAAQGQQAEGQGVQGAQNEHPP